MSIGIKIPLLTKAKTNYKELQDIKHALGKSKPEKIKQTTYI